MKNTQKKKIAKINQIYRGKGYGLTDEQAMLVWEQVSLKSGKNWLNAPITKEEELYELIIRKSTLAEAIEKSEIVKQLDRYRVKNKNKEAEDIVAQLKKII